MVGSGSTALSTSGSTALQVIASQVGMVFRGGYLVNGSTAGTYSIDNVTYQYLPASVSVPLPPGLYPSGVWVQGSGMTGISAAIW